MRILEVEIHNVRGIRDLVLKPNGQNLVLWGPNGSGKSAVVDALGFVLTGRIARLTGKGSGDLSLAEHGHHIDCPPESATVRAVLQIPGSAAPVEIKRCMADPGTLEFDSAVKPYLDPILALAHRGQHVLTRREILKYITAEGRSRAEEIQDLLNLGEVEETRRALVKVHNDLGKEARQAQNNLDTTRQAVNTTLRLPSFQLDAVLEAVNQARAILGAPPLAAARSVDLKQGVVLPAARQGQPAVNVTLLEADLTVLRDTASPSVQVEVARDDQNLRTLLAQLRADPLLRRAATQQQLITLGQQLLDESGRCPLCDTPWEPALLHQHLTQKLVTAQAASHYLSNIADLSRALRQRAAKTLASLLKISAALRSTTVTSDLPALQHWERQLQELMQALDEALDRYPAASCAAEQVQRLLAPENLAEFAERIHQTLKTSFPEATPEQTAWDRLTRLEENLKALEDSDANFHRAQLSHRRAELLATSYQKARDDVLEQLYTDICDRFVGLYQQLHKPDEGDFAATLKPQGAALNLVVSFHGRGAHPPHALHSEGHQDSMGICLYLALAEKLTQGLINLIIFDDVVMSVDAEHRRQLCRLLVECLPDRQFLITTHDKTWANQLRSEGVVTSKSTIEIYKWTLETGPQINSEVDLWNRIDADLQVGDVSAAAARLRRGSEEFLGQVCDSLQSPVRYRLDGRLELGDFLPGAMGHYRSLLKQAKKAAQSWGDQEAMTKLGEQESVAGQVFARLNVEQWAVNANVHYNNWANFTPADFRPVVDSFRDLSSLFVCAQCGRLLQAIGVGPTLMSVQCGCGKVTWNLKEKDKRN